MAAAMAAAGVATGVATERALRGDNRQMTALAFPALSRMTQALGFAGLLPFVGGALLVAAGPPAWHDGALRALVTYAAVIVSFLGGIHWGASPSAERDNARLWGVVPSLLAWPMLLLPSARWALLGLAASLIACWLVDRARFPSMGLAALLPLRMRLTAVATVCCVAAAAFS
jgi:hypothetical protein